MFMAILLVTVLVDDEDTAVDAKTVPVAAGRVSVFVPATAVGARVIWPEVAPLSVKLPIIRPSKLMMQE